MPSPPTPLPPETQRLRVVVRKLDSSGPCYVARIEFDTEELSSEKAGQIERVDEGLGEEKVLHEA